jgi:PAS domain S-box-containing protein
MSNFDWPRDNDELIRQLAKQRDRYEQLVNNMSDLLMLIQPDGVVSFCNRRSSLPPGATRYPPVGARALDYIAPPDRQAVDEAMQDVLSRSAAAREVLFRIGEEDADERIIEGMITPVLEDGNVIQLEFLGRDVTERHRAAEALREANAALEKRQADFQRDLDVAAKIHASLLPAPLVTQRVLIDLRHIPLLGVGGDYVHIRRGDPQRPAVTVFDVSGHGVASALVANRVHSAVYAIMSQGAPPPEMIERLNRFVYESFSELGIFVTLFGMELNLEAGEAYYCGSGHPPALLRKADTGRVLPLRSAHLPIGVAAHAFMGEPMEHVEIAPGDTVWLYTDGLIEIRNRAEEMLGVNGLTERVRSFDVADPQPGLAAACLEQILADQDEPEDDVTLLVAAIR